jgi:hypothetical protein
MIDFLVVANHRNAADLPMLAPLSAPGALGLSKLRARRLIK